MVYSSSNTSVATISGGSVVIVGVGTSIITASQPGDATYNPAANQTQTLTVTPKNLTYLGGVANNKTYDGTVLTTIASGSLQGIVGSDDITISSYAANFADPNAGNGKPVTAAFTFSGADVGKYTFTQPTFSGNIFQASQTITFAPLPDRTTADVSFIARATSTSEGVITFTSTNTSVATVTNDSVVNIIGVGTTMIIAHQSGTANFTAATDVSQSLVVANALTGWDFTGPGQTATFTSTYNTANINGTAVLSRGATATASPAPNSFRTQGFQNNGISTANTDYFQTTLSAAGGYELSLSSIEANYAGTASYVNTPGVTSQWAYSLNGTTFTLIGSPVTSTSLTASVDLSGITALQFIPSGTTVTFRYYASGQTNTGGWGFFSAAAGTAGLAFTGNITVAPEPSITLSQVHPNTTTIDQGTADALIGGLGVNVNTASAILNSVIVNTAGSYVAADFTNIKFWLSSSPTSITAPGSVQLGTSQASVASGAAVSVSGLNNTIVAGTTRYILITGTVAGNAVPGHTFNIATTPLANVIFASGNVNGTMGAGNPITISQLNPTIAISNVSPAGGTINQNTTNQILKSIKLDISVTSATFTGITMTTAGSYIVSDIAPNGFKFWINTTNNLTGATQLGAAQAVVLSGGNISVTGLSQLLNNNTTYYLLATADVSYSASPARNISIGQTSFNNINFVAADKTGTDAVPAGNTQIFGAITPGIALATSGATNATVGAPAPNSILYQFSAAVTTNSTALNAVTVTTTGTYTGADLVPNSFKLFYSSTNLFSSAVQIGINRPVVISGGTVSYTGLNQVITVGTTGYFWITADLASGAIAGHTIKINAPALSSIVFNQGNKSGTLTAGGTITLFPSPMLTDLIIPQYMEGTAVKMPFIYRAKLTNLKPNATYRYYNTMDTVGYTSASSGAGTIIFASSPNYYGISTGTLGTAGAYGEFTADASGTYSGWFINESTSNGRFAVGKNVMGRIFLNDGAGGTSIISRVQTTATAQVISFNTGAGVNNGTGIRGTSAGTPRNLVLLFDNANGTGRPISVASIEVNGFSQSGSYPAFYSSSVDAVAGAWGTIIPNNLPDGIRRIEQRDLTTGNLVNCPAVSTNGTWPGGTNTVNPTGGLTALALTTVDAPLNGTSYTWLGVNNLWGSVSNWACGVPNSNTADVTVPSNAAVMPLLNGDFTIRNLSLQGAATIDLGSKNLTINGAVSGTGTIKGSDYASLNINSTAGTLNFASGFRKLKALVLNTAATATLGTALDITPLNGGGSVTVNSGATLTTAGLLTLKSSVAGTASVLNSPGTISGLVTVERFINNNGYRAWRLLSVPTKSATQSFHTSWQENQAPMINGVPGYGTLLTSATGGNGYDIQTAGNSLLRLIPGNPGTFTAVTSTNNIMETTAGYMVYIRGDRSSTPIGGTLYNATPTTLRTTGTLYQGNVTVPVAGGNINVLVGNIYPSAIDFSTLNHTGITSFKVWDPKLAGTSAAGAYQTFSFSNGYDPVPGGGSYGNTANTRIENGQAFIVNSSTPSSVDFSESAKVTGSRNVFRTNDVIRQFKANLYAINSVPVVDTTKADGNSTTFGAFSNAIDNDDAIKATNFGENFGVLRDSIVLAVDARQPLANLDTIFYRIWNIKPQPYILEFVPRNFDTLGVTAFLEDNFLNTRLPISVSDTTTVPVSFTSAPGSLSNTRFRVVFKRNTILPVTFMTINAKEKEYSVLINWTVAGEQRIDHYEIEHSIDGRKFTKAGEVKANSTSQNVLSYNWLHENAAKGINFYRVKSVDFSNIEKYSSIVSVVIGKGISSFNITPNPVTNNRLNLQFINQAAGEYSLRLVNGTGQLLFSKNIVLIGGNSTLSFELPSEIAPGIYNLEVAKPGGVDKNVQKIIISK